MARKVEKPIKEKKPKISKVPKSKPAKQTKTQVNIRHVDVYVTTKPDKKPKSCRRTLGY